VSATISSPRCSCDRGAPGGRDLRALRPRPVHRGIRSRSSPDRGEKNARRPEGARRSPGDPPERITGSSASPGRKRPDPQAHDRADEARPGQVLVGGVDINRLSRRELDGVRNRFGDALPDRRPVRLHERVRERRLPPPGEDGADGGGGAGQVRGILEKVGLEAAEEKFPTNSPGMVRRAALARAVVMDRRSSSSTSPHGLDPSSGTPS